MATSTPSSESPGVEANARLTALTGIALFVLLAAEGITILDLGSFLPAHFFIGFLLIPPVLLKLASTGYRFARYYLGDRHYREAGPPAPLLRAVAPVVVASTVVVLGSGVELWLFGMRFGDIWLTLHKLGFVVWFFATAVHVLGYLIRAPRLAVADLRPGGSVPGALTRRSLLTASLLLGLVLALSTLPFETPFGGPPEG
jgi:hypothetical protein